MRRVRLVLGDVPAGFTIVRLAAGLVNDQKGAAAERQHRRDDERHERRRPRAAARATRSLDRVRGDEVHHPVLRRSRRPPGDGGRRLQRFAYSAFSRPTAPWAAWPKEWLTAV